MASKSDKFYFGNLVQAAECSCKAADYLVECLSNYNSKDITQMLNNMHAIEHLGDIRKHEMSAALAKAFVTPVDREDLALISQSIDDVTDCIEEVLQRFYVDSIRTVIPGTAEFSKKLADCCRLMKDMLEKFPGFKRPEELHNMIVEINRCEEECDSMYLEATLRVREHCSDVLDIMLWREIYDRLEDCADACEHVGDCVDMIVMKNT